MPLVPKGLSTGLVQRIRDKIKTYFGGGEEAAPGGRDPLLEGPGTDAPVILYRIRHSARTRTLLYMKYNNTWRHIEPYSFRNRSRGMQPLFYAWCELHDEIHSFRIDRIQDMVTTDRPYTPRFPVEIA